MKRIIPAVLLFAALIFLLPLAAFPLQSGGSTAPAAVSLPQAASPSGSAPAVPSAAAGETFRILDTSTGEVMEVTASDYVLGAVAAEMPMTYDAQALAAQAVAAHSYALALKSQTEKSPELAAAGADFSADPNRRLGFITQDVMKLLWGGQYDEYYARLTAAVTPVLGEVLTYNGQPALACYHAISNGTTESAQAVWGGEVPYLVPVDSSLDKTSPDYEQTLSMTAQEMKECLSPNFAGLDLSGDPSGWFGIFERTPEGYVSAVHLGAVSCDGTDIRAALGLRSSDFTITWTTDHFAVTTRGYGHGVGMSQYGANAMALQGKTYAEILAYYYPGTVLTART